MDPAIKEELDSLKKDLNFLKRCIQDLQKDSKSSAAKRARLCRHCGAAHVDARPAFSRCSACMVDICKQCAILCSVCKVWFHMNCTPHRDSSNRPVCSTCVERCSSCKGEFPQFDGMLRSCGQHCSGSVCFPCRLEHISNWRMVYFSLALDCPLPVLEVLKYGIFEAQHAHGMALGHIN